VTFLKNRLVCVDVALEEYRGNFCEIIRNSTDKEYVEVRKTESNSDINEDDD
jgi:hypothetical protein